MFYGKTLFWHFFKQNCIKTILFAANSSKFKPHDMSGHLRSIRRSILQIVCNFPSSHPLSAHLQTILLRLGLFSHEILAYEGKEDPLLRGVGAERERRLFRIEQPPPSARGLKKGRLVRNVEYLQLLEMVEAQYVMEAFLAVNFQIKSISIHTTWKL